MVKAWESPKDTQVQSPLAATLGPTLRRVAQLVSEGSTLLENGRVSQHGRTLFLASHWVSLVHMPSLHILSSGRACEPVSVAGYQLFFFFLQKYNTTLNTKW